MSKTITIKLTKAGPQAGPFTISDQFGNVIAQDVLRKTLIAGISYSVADNTTMLVIKSTGSCRTEKVVNLSTITRDAYASIQFSQTTTACIWRHLTNIQLYNSYYGIIHPYIIEYPNDTTPTTEILQNIQDYSKVYKYLYNDNFNSNSRIEVDDKYFNKLIVYNDQQSSGMLELVSKPINNLYLYNKYPIYNLESKTVLYTKSDNYYKINTFWDIVKNKTETLFVSSCISSSIDKEINQNNMIYTPQSFKKSPLRAKNVKVRYILDNDSSIHIVSQIIIFSSQISYK